MKGRYVLCSKGLQYPFVCSSHASTTLELMTPISIFNIHLIIKCQILWID